MSALPDTKSRTLRRSGAAGATRTLVLGAGDTGLACVRHLLNRRDTVRVADDRDAPPQAELLRKLLPDGALRLGVFESTLLDGMDRVVVSPGLPGDLPLLQAARARGLPVLGELDLFVAEARAPVVAVTGTNGKSTVTTLVAAMLHAGGLEARAGGNLGPAALSLLDTEGADRLVLEVSSFQLEQTPRLPCLAAVVLNVSPDHLDRHGSIDAYSAIKARVYAHAEHCVINLDDDRVARMCPAGADCIGFTMSAPGDGDYGLVEYEGGPWLARGASPLVAASALRIHGRHNLANALAALALCEAAGGDLESAVEALLAFRPLPHRCERVPSDDGLTWIDDSKGTNLAATVAAVCGMPGPLVLIAGGIAKESNFGPLAVALEGRARGVVLIGRDAPLLAAALEDRVPVQHAAGMDEAVTCARAIAQPGDTVILSPACASFDQFSDYRARGRAFAAAVQGVPS